MRVANWTKTTQVASDELNYSYQHRLKHHTIGCRLLVEDPRDPLADAAQLGDGLLSSHSRFLLFATSKLAIK